MSKLLIYIKLPMVAIFTILRKCPHLSTIYVFNTWHWRQQRLTLTLTSLFPTAIPISARSFSKEAIISVARFFWWLVISLSFWSSASILAKVTYSKRSYPWLNETLLLLELVSYYSQSTSISSERTKKYWGQRPSTHKIKSWSCSKISVNIVKQHLEWYTIKYCRESHL